MEELGARYSKRAAVNSSHGRAPRRKKVRDPRSHAFALFCLIFMLFVSVAGYGQALGKVIVHSKFGGQIFGFDIDQNGSEGVLSEAQTLANGLVLAAVETFDQQTGKIIAVVSMTQTTDD